MSIEHEKTEAPFQYDESCVVSIDDGLVFAKDTKGKSVEIGTVSDVRGFGLMQIVTGRDLESKVSPPEGHDKLVDLYKKLTAIEDESNRPTSFELAFDRFPDNSAQVKTNIGDYIVHRTGRHFDSWSMPNLATGETYQVGLEADTQNGVAIQGSKTRDVDDILNAPDTPAQVKSVLREACKQQTYEQAVQYLKRGGVYIYDSGDTVALTSQDRTQEFRVVKKGGEISIEITMNGTTTPIGFTPQIREQLMGRTSSPDTSLPAISKAIVISHGLKRLDSEPTESHSQDDLDAMKELEKRAAAFLAGSSL